MAIEVPGFKDATRIAGADLSALQYTFVKIATGNKVVACAAVTDVPYGILQNNPANNQTAEIMCNGISKIKTAAATTEGALLGTDGSGLGAIYVNGTDTTKYIVGRCVAATGAANGIGSIAFDCLTPNRGA